MGSLVASSPPRLRALSPKAAKAVVATCLSILCALVGCESTPPADNTFLILQDDKRMGRPPPSWLFIAKGQRAYVHAFGAAACSTLAGYLEFNSSTYQGAAGCRILTLGTWVRIHQVEKIGKARYVAEIEREQGRLEHSYIGAAELSPEIPYGTSLVTLAVHDDPWQTTEEVRNKIPMLRVDRKTRVADLPFPTYVLVQRVLPSQNGAVWVYVRIKYGPLRGTYGYISILDLATESGQDYLTDYVGSQS